MERTEGKAMTSAIGPLKYGMVAPGSMFPIMNGVLVIGPVELVPVAMEFPFLNSAVAPDCAVPTKI